MSGIFLIYQLKESKMNFGLFYILSAIVVCLYLVYDYKKLIKSYNYNKKEFIKGATMAALLPIVNTLIAGLAVLGGIFQAYYKVRKFC
jgi:hypothetical protein